MREYFTLNGDSIEPQGRAGEFAKDRGLAYGHSLFETILYRKFEIPLIDRHLERICRDAKLIGIPIEVQQLEIYLNQFLQILKSDIIAQGVIKVIATAGPGGRGYAPPALLEPSVLCTYSPLPEDIQRQWLQGIAVRCCTHRLPHNTALAGVKHLNRLDQVLARSEWNCSNYHEGLMFCSQGKLIEAISANVFIKIDGDWLTPSLTDAGVNGVMRSLLLTEICADNNIHVKVTSIDITQLNMCQEMFICNSIRGIIPVTQVYSDDGVLLKSLPRGEQTLMLRERLVSKYPHYQ